MDSTRNLCKVKDSFSNATNVKNAKNVKNEIPKFEEIVIGSPRSIRSKLFQNNKNNKIILEESSGILPNEISDPFQQIKDEYFNTRSSLVLANIDLVFNFTDQDRGYIVLQYLNKIDYAVLDGDEGFLKYLQFRLPAARGFTNCSVIDKKVEKKYLNINCENGLAKYVLSIAPEGLPLVLSNSLNYKENLLTALKIIKPDGTFISRIDNNTNVELLYLTSLCFESFTIFKPFLENLNENYSYIIAQKYKGNSIDIISHLENFKGSFVSEAFLQYIKNYYNSLNKLKKDLLLEKPKYNMYKCKSILNIF